jgi:hypothetical protein
MIPWVKIITIEKIQNFNFFKNLTFGTALFVEKYFEQF